MDQKGFKEHYDHLYSEKPDNKKKEIDKYYFLSRKKDIVTFLHYINEHENSKKVPLKLLDNGTGDGSWWDLLLNHNVKLFGVDISLPQIKKALIDHKGKCSAIVIGDVRTLPFHITSFDVIFGSEIIEHLLVGEEREYFSEAYKSLKSGGWLIITTPNALEYRRVIQNIIIKIFSVFYQRDPEEIKAGLFRKYINYTGHSAAIEVVEESGFVGHFNVMTPFRLKRSLLESGFEVVYMNPQMIVLPISKPFLYKNWVPSFFLKVELFINTLPFIKWLLLGGMAVLCRKKFE